MIPTLLLWSVSVTFAIGSAGITKSCADGSVTTGFGAATGAGATGGGLPSDVQAAKASITHRTRVTTSSAC